MSSSSIYNPPTHATQSDQIAMNSLVTYASSDDEDEEQKVTAPVHTDTEKQTPSTAPKPQPQIQLQPQPAAEVAEVAALPEQQPAAPRPRSASPESSPYTTTRTALHNLTMPTTPNFSIPASPPPPPTNSEASAVLAARTKKFERFLDLKRQGVHFNARLQGSSALRNPALLAKLMAFARIGREEAYASSLGEGLGVAVKWPEECHAAALLKANERREKKRKTGAEVSFVSEKKGRFGR